MKPVPLERLELLGEKEKKGKYNYLKIMFFRGVGEMKKGDYMVHVFIEKVKEIKLADG